MIVGDNPGFEELVEQLTGERQDLPTAALAGRVCQVVEKFSRVSSRRDDVNYAAFFTSFRSR
jgi:hypothetical protein